MDIEKNIIVTPTDTDSYNIIHHPQYFIWIEEAILEWLISTYGSLEQVSYEICKFQCKFISPGILYDSLVLRLIPKSRKRNDYYEDIKFQVRLMIKQSKKTVIESDFYVKVKGKTDG